MRRFIIISVITCVFGNLLSVTFHAANLANSDQDLCESWMLFAIGMNLAWCVVMTMLILYGNWSLWRHMQQCHFVDIYSNAYNSPEDTTPVMRRHVQAYRQNMTQQPLRNFPNPRPTPNPTPPPPPPPRTQPPPQPQPQPQRYEYIDLQSLPR